MIREVLYTKLAMQIDDDRRTMLYRNKMEITKIVLWCLWESHITVSHHYGANFGVQDFCTISESLQKVNYKCFTARHLTVSAFNKTSLHDL